MDAVVYSIALCAISFAAFLCLKRFDKRLTLHAGVLFAAYVGFGDLVTGLPPAVAELRFVVSRWNWSGQVYCLLFSIAAAIALRLHPAAMGIALPRKNLAAGCAALVLLTATSVVIGLVFRPSPPSFETVAFQLLAPSLAEELMFRGIAPALLLGLLRGRAPGVTTPWVAILVAAVPYGVVHGLGYSDGSFSFDWLYAAYTYLGGAIYGWLRFSTGSLLFPVLAHGFGNAAFALTGFV